MSLDACLVISFLIFGGALSIAITIGPCFFIKGILCFVDLALFLRCAMLMSLLTLMLVTNDDDFFIYF